MVVYFQENGSETQFGYDAFSRRINKVREGQGLWHAHHEERSPIPLLRYLGDVANEKVYCELRY
ncbi:hypothetical protein [Pectobacterium wasabiae]|uniref:Transposase n=1 Tax=Pectobacterium wasabiae TaxID=55208 RepID=A0AAW3EEQ6_9GAMM|nr:hypothetical protein [Pectobacterium wasabiae]AOR63400.1 hypothetical protein A7983_09025 [Pectobacterium wasabiae CFBP 3304]KFX04101.1 hypothetical protein JV38_16390 [Pectobacterium wasabiae]KGA27235.1 hypothetical protein KU73_16380 [Pectobacterium wasabiae]